MTELIKLQVELEEIIKRKEKAIEEYEYELASALRNREQRLMQLVEDEHAAD